MVLKIKHHSKRIAAITINRIKGFTLIELLIVIAILGILAAAVLVAINPGKRLAQARDAQRKSDISAIANALVGYYTINSYYPFENMCDSSIGSDTLDICIYMASPQNDWDNTAIGYIYQDLITNQSFLKRLPKDPINNLTYNYRYEPATESQATCDSPTGVTCQYYWVGVRLEAVDPAKTQRIVYRCTDNTTLTAGAGCKEVEYPTVISIEGQNVR